MRLSEQNCWQLNWHLYCLMPVTGYVSYQL